MPRHARRTCRLPIQVVVPSTVTPRDWGRTQQILDHLAYLRDWEVLERLKVAPEDLQGVAAHAAAVLRDSSMSIAAEAGIRHAYSVFQSGEMDLQRCRVWADKVLDFVGDGIAEEQILRRFPTESEAIIRGSAAYGAEALRWERFGDGSDDPPGEAYLRSQFSEEDRRLVQDYYVFVRGKAIYVPPSLEVDLGKWQRCVVDVEAPTPRYDEDETRLWLSRRDVLEDALTLISPKSLRRIEQAVRPWDDRFFAATAAVEGMWDTRAWTWKPQRWWWHRRRR